MAGLAGPPTSLVAFSLHWSSDRAPGAGSTRPPRRRRRGDKDPASLVPSSSAHSPCFLPRSRPLPLAPSPFSAPLTECLFRRGSRRARGTRPPASPHPSDVPDNSATIHYTAGHLELEPWLVLRCPPNLIPNSVAATAAAPRAPAGSRLVQARHLPPLVSLCRPPVPLPFLHRRPPPSTAVVVAGARSRPRALSTPRTPLRAHAPLTAARVCAPLPLSRAHARQKRCRSPALARRIYLSPQSN